MPQVLTNLATITCPHGGVGTTVPTTPVIAQGGFVSAENDVGALSCVFIVPCVGYTLRSMGLNASTVLGRKVILATDFQQSFTGMPLVIVETRQVVDDSTPASIPAGQSAPPLSPELLDVAPPVIVAAPPAGAFVTAPVPTPPSLPITFTLNAPFPMQWMLRLLNTTAKVSVDLTNGLPPNATVIPAGGAWTTPTLVVTVTLLAPFMAGLGPGLHNLYMIGVTQRGASSFARFDLTVS